MSPSVTLGVKLVIQFYKICCQYLKEFMFCILYTLPTPDPSSFTLCATAHVSLGCMVLSIPATNSAIMT
jgi:hypothetical protein